MYSNKNFLFVWKVVHNNKLFKNKSYTQSSFMLQQSEDLESSKPDINTFLSTMLLELGILTQHDNGLELTNQNIKSLELETGDGSQITLELMEEDDVEEQEQVGSYDFLILIVIRRQLSSGTIL